LFDYDLGVVIEESYWEEKIKENLDREDEEEDLPYVYNEDNYKNIMFNLFGEDKAIDDLFTKGE
jgi:hypothetical protein